MNISPSILYPGIVVGLLAFSVGSSFYLLRTARSDDGAQIMDNYYNDALAWDQAQAERARVQELGWELQWRFDDTGPGRIEVRNAADEPVEGLLAEVIIRRPQFSDPVGTSALVAIDGEPGSYAFEHGTLREGLWDLELRGTYADQALRVQRRVQVAP